jgi:type VI secretion system protein ImpA
LIDIEQFCSVLDGDKPAGSDLEYDPDFLALEVAQKGKAERQYGDTLIPAEPPDWQQVLAYANALATRTRDLRIACTLTRALTHLHGLQGLVRGMQVTDRLCREMWERVFPSMDESVDNDPTFRMNALAPFADREVLLADIRDCIFVSARGMGICTVRQLETALGVLTPSRDSVARSLDIAEIDAIVASAQAEGGFAENHAQQAIDLVHGLQTYLSDRVGVASAPDMQPLVARLRTIAEYSKKFIAGRSAAPAQEDAIAPQSDTAGPAMATPPNRSSAAIGEIRSSQDAARMLDLICAYFEQNEPTNPAPLLLRRAQRLSTMNFYDIVRDIAPDAISSVDLVAGSRSQS